MPSLVSPDAVRTRFESDLPDAVIQPIIDAEEAAIVRLFGPHASAVETRLATNQTVILLARPASTITSIVEVRRWLNGTYIEPTSLTLDPTDYALGPANRLIRLATGVNPYSRWGDEVTITYLPLDQTAERTEVLMKLVGLGLAYSGYRIQTAPDLSESPLDPSVTRNRILRQLAPSIGFA